MAVDIIVVLFAGCLCFQGYRKGFILTVFDTLGFILSFFLSKEFYHYAEDFLLNNTKLFVKLHDYFETKITVDNIQKMGKIPVELQKFLNNIMASEVTDTYSAFIDNLSLLLIRSISFIVTFLAIYAGLLLLAAIINLIMKLPLLNITNRIFGAFMGILKSVIVLYLVFALAAPILSFMQDKPVVQAVLDSESSKIFYDNNIILNYLSYKGFYDNYWREEI